MNDNQAELIQGYLDDSLTTEQHQTLTQWIQADDAHAHAFATEVLLHDRLHSIADTELSNKSAVSDPADELIELRNAPAVARRSRMLIGMATAVCLLLFSGLLVWQYAGSNTLSAAEVELNRLISASSRLPDQTFVIAVEESILPAKEAEKFPADRQRPPKPSLDGALLYVRGQNQFVLQRKLKDNQFFVTGCNGQTSWAVQPKGPVRVSSDLTRFNHDVPGHEHSMPLNNLHDGLEQLRVAYEINVLPVEQVEDEGLNNSEPNRLLVAVKKPGLRGPKRVEISYAAISGQIRQIRFMGMPYGPERLTVRMTWVDGQQQSPDFFDHESHHDPMRTVEYEE
jgi:hypothetical protein